MASDRTGSDGRFFTRRSEKQGARRRCDSWLQLPVFHVVEKSGIRFKDTETDLCSFDILPYKIAAATVSATTSGPIANDAEVNEQSQGSSKDTAAVVTESVAPVAIPSQSRAVLVLDSDTCRAVVGQIVEAREPRERKRLVRISTNIVTADATLMDWLAEPRPDIVIAHVHAFAPLSNSSDTAVSQLIEQFKVFDERNRAVCFVVYSGQFVVAGGGGALGWVGWLSRTRPSAVSSTATFRSPQSDSNIRSPE